MVPAATEGRCPRAGPSPATRRRLPRGATPPAARDLHGPALCRAIAHWRPASPPSSVPSWPTEAERGAAQEANATAGAEVPRSPDPGHAPAVRAARCPARNARGAWRPAHRRLSGAAPSGLRSRSAGLEVPARLPCGAYPASEPPWFHPRARRAPPKRNSRRRCQRSHRALATSGAPGRARRRAAG